MQMISYVMTSYKSEAPDKMHTSYAYKIHKLQKAPPLTAAYKIRKVKA